ncbi:MAG TPA: oligosaccharide flippase family protein, partial [Verrucomicrobiae bacterium]|nr:oligosaccharide flippase family protein [Verrucomicrobiae bacterium]
AGCTLLGLWFTPYLIHRLGVAGYGLVPLASMFASYLGLLTIAIDVPIARYLTLALARGETERANRVFNSGLWAMIGILAIALPPLLLVCWKGLWWLNVPPGLRSQFSLLAFCVVFMFCTGAVGGVFGASAYSENRLDLSSSVNLLANALRVGVVVLLFGIVGPALWVVGFGMVISSAASLGLLVLVWSRLTPQLRVRARCFSKSTLREMAGFGGWTVINQVGTLLFLSIDLLVVNTVLGAEASGRYATAMTFSGLLRNVGGVIAAVFGPTILALYAKGNTKALLKYSRQAVRFVGCLMALPVALVCGLSRPLLETWLGPSFESLNVVMILLTFHLCLNLAVLPLFNIQVATGHVRWPGLVTCGMGAINLGLALLLAGPLGWNFYGVAAAGAITLSLKNLIFTPLYCSHLLGQPWHTFIRDMVPITVLTLVLAAAAWGMDRWLRLRGWADLFSAGTGLGLIWALAAYGLLLSASERVKVRGAFYSGLCAAGVLPLRDPVQGITRQ